MKTVFYTIIILISSKLLFAVDFASIGVVGGVNYSQYNLDKSSRVYKTFVRDPQSDYMRSWQIGLHGEIQASSHISILTELNYKNIKLNSYDVDTYNSSADGPSYGSSKHEFLTLTLLGKISLHKYSPHILFGLDNMYYFAYESESCRGGSCSTWSNDFYGLNQYILGAVLGIGKDIQFNQIIVKPEIRYTVGLSTMDNPDYETYENYIRFNSFQILLMVGYSI